MRVLADTNLFISYLLMREEHSGAIKIFFQAFVEGRFTLLMPQDLLDELVGTVTRKPYLRKAISASRMTQAVRLIEMTSEDVPAIEQPVPRICRDPDDDYLLAYAMVGGADYLVTGDNDLLVLQKVGAVTIVSPSDFAAILGASTT